MERVKLKDICRLINGRAYKQEELLDSGKYPVLRVGNFFSDKDFYYSDLELEEDKYCDNGDLLFAWSASFGPKIWDGEKVIYHYHIWKMELTDRVNKEFLFYYLFHLSERIKSEGHGGIMIHTTKSEMEEREFNLPTHEEQIAISEILNKVKSVIDKRKEELSALDDLIKARFVEMFGDAVDNPMGWEKRQLQEIVTDDCTISYGIVQTGDDQEEGVPVFRPIDIVNRVPKLDELKKTTEEISNKYKRTVLKGHEMLITVRANIADTYVIGEEFKGCNVGRGIVPIRTKEDIMVLEFLKYLMDSKHLNDNIKSKAKGITLVQLNMEDLREVELIVPPLEQQKFFVEFVHQVDKSKVAVQKALKEVEELFDSLMQQYFG